MLYNPQKHHRRSIRLKGYDYSQAGAYFVTMCVRSRAGVTPPLLGDVADKRMRLNEFGEIVVAGWHGVTDHFPHVETDAFVVMPNHIHGIVIIADVVGAGSPRPYVPSSSSSRKWALGHIVAYFKYQSTKRINEIRGTPGVPFWQRNYHDHIIRNKEALDRIRRYIADNPARWGEDQNNPDSPMWKSR